MAARTASECPPSQSTRPAIHIWRPRPSAAASVPLTWFVAEMYGDVVADIYRQRVTTRIRDAAAVSEAGDAVRILQHLFDLPDAPREEEKKSAPPPAADDESGTRLPH